MIKRLRVLLVIIVSCVGFVGLANAAVFWHGAPMILGIGPLMWATDSAFGWALKS